MDSRAAAGKNARGYRRTSCGRPIGRLALEYGKRMWMQLQLKRFREPNFLRKRIGRTAPNSIRRRDPGTPPTLPLGKFRRHDRVREVENQSEVAGRIFPE